MSFTFSESMHPAKREEYKSHILVLFRFLALRLFHIICRHFDRDGRTVMPVIKPGPIRGKFQEPFQTKWLKLRRKPQSHSLIIPQCKGMLLEEVTGV